MGNEICSGASKDEPLAKIQQEEIKVSLQPASKEDLSKRIMRQRVEINAFPMLNKHVEERIKKLSKVPINSNKIWKIKQPYNIIYANTDKLLSEELPKGYVQVYKLKEGGEFQGYFQGNLSQSYEPGLKDSIFVYPNASYFVGTSSNEGTYANEVTSLNYTGGWSNEQPQGEGVEKNNKGTYRGQYNLGQKEGKGKFQWVDGSTFEGQFLKGLFHGKGVILDPANKYSYEGEFRNGEKDGKGVQKYELEAYDGEFHKGKRCGTGTLTVFNPSDKSIKLTFQGNFCKGLPNGRGKIRKSKSEEAVTGIWQDGKMILLSS